MERQQHRTEQRSVHGNPNTLSDLEKKRIKELQEATTKSRHGRPISWGLAQRLILARKGNLQKAIDLYENFVQRFSKLNLLDIDPQHPPVLEQLTSGKYCLPGTQAQDGSALLVFRTKHHTVSRGQAHHHANLSACFFLLTEAQSTVQAQRLGVTIVFDMRGAAWSNIDYALIKTMLNLLQNAFPGRLANAYIFKAPRWFRAMTSLFWPFMKAKMKERVRLVDALQGSIAPNQLPDFLGGELPYNHKASVDAMVKRHITLRSQRRQRLQQQHQHHQQQRQQQQQQQQERKGRVQSPHHHYRTQDRPHGQMQRARVDGQSSAVPHHPAQQRHHQQQQRDQTDERATRQERLQRRQQQQRAKLDEQQQVRLQRNQAVHEHHQHHQHQQQHHHHHQQQQQQQQPRVESPLHHPPPVPPRRADAGRGQHGHPQQQPQPQPQRRFQSQPHPHHHETHRHSELMPASAGARGAYARPHASASVAQEAGASSPVGQAVSRTRRQHRQRHPPAQQQQQQRAMAQSSVLLTAYPLQSPHVVSGPELPAFIQRLVETGEVVSHFAMLQLEEEEVDFTSAKLPVNVRKNRYGNVLPNEDTRVRLQDSEDIGGDYINANFIVGYRGPKRFVATQGPLRSTAADFWRMVWGTGASTIAMTAQEMEGGRKKCHRYWPDEQDETMEAGPVLISIKEKKQWSESVIHRLFCLQHRSTGKTRCVDHLQFTAWPDHGVPADPQPFLDFQRNVTRFAERAPERGPIVVHCSAGIGRTGTFIAVDIARHQLQAEKRVDVYGIIRELRRQRAGMVQTPPQYLFCYQALAHLLENSAL